VTLVDIPADNPPLGLRAIELLHQEMPDAAIFALGNLNQPQVIVNAMRPERVNSLNARQHGGSDRRLCAPAGRATPRPAGRHSRQNFLRHQRKGGNGATRGRQPGAGFAIHLRADCPGDMAPLGHAALHMNLKPASIWPMPRAIFTAWTLPCSRVS